MRTAARFARRHAHGQRRSSCLPATSPSRVLGTGTERPSRPVPPKARPRVGNAAAMPLYGTRGSPRDPLESQTASRARHRPLRERPSCLRRVRGFPRKAPKHGTIWHFPPGFRQVSHSREPWHIPNARGRDRRRRCLPYMQACAQHAIVYTVNDSRCPPAENGDEFSFNTSRLETSPNYPNALKHGEEHASEDVANKAATRKSKDPCHNHVTCYAPAY